MAVRVISAPPGKGKTLNMTRIAIKLYKEANSFFKRHKKKKCQFLFFYLLFLIFI